MNHPTSHIPAEPGHRYYDPLTGRFTQTDPIGLAGGLNAYGFADGDPANFSDPFGLCPEWFDGKPCTLGDVANFAAGFGDALTFGLTNKIRERIGGNEVVDRESGIYLAGELGGLAAGSALGASTAQAIRSGATLATSGATRTVAAELLTTRTGQALFGKGGLLNEGRAFRLGVSRAKDGGRLVFRAAGDAVERAAGRAKIDLIDLGKIEDFIRRIP